MFEASSLTSGSASPYKAPAAPPEPKMAGGGQRPPSWLTERVHMPLETRNSGNAFGNLTGDERVRPIRRHDATIEFHRPRHRNRCRQSGQRPQTQPTGKLLVAHLWNITKILNNAELMNP